MSGKRYPLPLISQNLLYRFLSDNLPDYHVQEQYVLDNIMSYVENPHKRQAPQLRPDYVVKQKGKAVAILDAKYRDLWQASLPPHMLYQLIMYALGQGDCDRATILYPTIQPVPARPGSRYVYPSMSAVGLMLSYGPSTSCS